LGLAFVGLGFLLVRPRVKITSDAVVSYGLVGSRNVPVREIADIEIKLGGKRGDTWKTVVKLVDGQEVDLEGLEGERHPEDKRPPIELTEMVSEVRGLIGLEPKPVEGAIENPFAVQRATSLDRVLDVERFRAVPWYPTVFLALFVMISALNLVGNGFSWWLLIGVGAIALFAYLCLMTFFEATIGPGRVVTFRAVLRRRMVHIEDVRSIRPIDLGGLTYWKVRFVGGAGGLSGGSGKRLAQRLCQVNPTIKTAFDPVPGREEEQFVEMGATTGMPATTASQLCCSKAVGKPNGRHYGPCARN
jgi:hypothetical protein